MQYPHPLESTRLSCTLVNFGNVRTKKGVTFLIHWIKKWFKVHQKDNRQVLRWRGWPPGSSVLIRKICCPLHFLLSFLKYLFTNIMEVHSKLNAPIKYLSFATFPSSFWCGKKKLRRFFFSVRKNGKVAKWLPHFATWSNFAICSPISIILVSKCIRKVCWVS